MSPAKGKMVPWYIDLFNLSASFIVESNTIIIHPIFSQFLYITETCLNEDNILYQY
jgi:hypothetical protein